jgi:16S rRNA (uracil1498-N3)-methyltransferase
MIERRKPRLYVAAGLASGAEIELDRTQAHYLRSVLRLDAGAAITGFNATDGEWLCRLVEFGKHGARVTVEAQLRQAEREAESDLWLVFAPIKRARLDWLVEKATELGVSALLPVWTVRTQVERVNLERLRAHAIEAVEQSERVSVPEIKAPEALQRVLASWPAARPLILCDERGKGEPIVEAMARLPRGPLALLVGPEGGFAQTELDAVGKLTFVIRVGLGPRVLRAETAALAAVAVVQAIVGDWRLIRPVDRACPMVD